MNLTALESALRFFLLKANNQTFTAPTDNAADAPVNYMTKYVFLRDLINAYNGKLTAAELAKYKVDDKPERIRDALAHGRLVAPLKDVPLTLWKFGRQSSGRVPIEFHDVLTKEWLEETWKYVDQQKTLVVTCSKERGYPIS
jgi:hypothetical protein